MIPILIIFLKAYDFLFQAIPIIWIFLGIFLSKFVGQGGALTVVIILGFLILPYQFISSIILGIVQISRKKFNKITMARMFLCVGIVLLLVLCYLANLNCWSVKDVLTFSNHEVEAYKVYYAQHKGEPFVHPLCVQMRAVNNIFIREQVFIMWFVPAFFFLTIIERVRDILYFLKKV